MKYKKSTTQLVPGFTYLFEWPDSSVFEGVYLRRNSVNSKVYLFKVVSKTEYAPVFTPRDEVLKECVWVNDESWINISGLWETDKPNFVKPNFDKKEDLAAALVFSGLPMHSFSCCPVCGQEGKFLRMALVCPSHGVFGGI